MDIDVIRSAKAQCESEIRAILDMFKHQYGLVPLEVRVHHIDATRFEHSRQNLEISSVEIILESI